jgi:predicted nucleic acid-binding protein
MSVELFVDTNVLVYLVGDDKKKKTIARKIIAERPAVPAQALSELANVLLKKFSVEPKSVLDIVSTIEVICTVYPVEPVVIRKALELIERYHFSYYDALIIACALENGGKVLYSEDMQSGMVIERTLRIVNPFA